MSSVLVPIADMVAFLGDLPEGDTAATDLLTALIDDVEAAFLAACGRPARPFGDVDAARVEVKDGTGSRSLWLDRPIVALTSVLLGHDSADPEETLDVADQTELSYRVGDVRLVRLDGGIFGAAGAPNYVRVTYSAGADLPADAKLAIMHATASVWRQLGSEGALSESIGPYRTDYAELLAGNGSVTSGNPVWRAAVQAHREVHV